MDAGTIIALVIAGLVAFLALRSRGAVTTAPKAPSTLPPAAAPPAQPPASASPQTSTASVFAPAPAPALPAPTVAAGSPSSPAASPFYWPPPPGYVAPPPPGPPTIAGVPAAPTTIATGELTFAGWPPSGPAGAVIRMPASNAAVPGWPAQITVGVPFPYGINFRYSASEDPNKYVSFVTALIGRKYVDIDGTVRVWSGQPLMPPPGLETFLAVPWYPITTPNIAPCSVATGVVYDPGRQRMVHTGGAPGPLAIVTEQGVCANGDKYYVWRADEPLRIGPFTAIYLPV